MEDGKKYLTLNYENNWWGKEIEYCPECGKHLKEEKEGK